MLREREQATLSTAGFSDVRVEVGYFRHGDVLRLEVRLFGKGDRVAQARKLLPFSDNQI